MKQAELPALPAKLTSEERFERILRLYEGVVEEGVAAIRLTLPPHEPFTVPHNLFLRAAVHKDVLCGTNVSAGADPASLVLFGRVEVVDVPPAVGASPAAIKQCEVEGGVPVIEVSASGTTFAAMDVSRRTAFCWRRCTIQTARVSLRLHQRWVFCHVCSKCISGCGWQHRP
ncbi:hypothetical protein C4B63_61g94 [Trypanosoma cruzi]|uniref:Uncharacterized protein n=1 Tax=Trypanosoma cruzi TaxID=5693 RepID=A0A2V2V1A5_TRYCR|nr:hypothetical protein C4B63_61g94 [Trypanosoma cruzi]